MIITLILWPQWLVKRCTWKVSLKNPDGYTYFYWYSVQGEGGNAVEESESYIDKKHIEYWDECIDPEYKPVDMKLEENLIAPAVERIIGQNTEN